MYVALYGSPDETPLDAAIFDPPAGSFSSPTPAACRCLRCLAPHRSRRSGPRDSAELKRMYVVQAARGRGLSRADAGPPRGHGRAAGAEALVLETGTGSPRRSRCTSSGYIRMAGFGHYRTRRVPVLGSAGTMTLYQPNYDAPATSERTSVSGDAASSKWSRSRPGWRRSHQRGQGRDLGDRRPGEVRPVQGQLDADEAEDGGEAVAEVHQLGQRALRARSRARAARAGRRRWWRRPGRGRR